MGLMKSQFWKNKQEWIHQSLQSSGEMFKLKRTKTANNTAESLTVFTLFFLQRAGEDTHAAALRGQIPMAA